jgi:hypothetical protein
MAYKDTKRNAERFSGAWEPMCFFHLRPAKSGATLVCTLPVRGIAMRGRVNVKPVDIEELMPKLRLITPDMGFEAIRGKLDDLGFAKQTSKTKEDENLIQAEFINMLYDNPNALSGCGLPDVRFIASELVYPTVYPMTAQDGVLPDNKKKIIDVVAESENHLLLIEIKKGSRINPGDDENQLKRYSLVYFGDDNDINTYTILQNYPNHKLTSDKPLKLVYLMKELPGAVNSPKHDAKGNLVLRYTYDVKLHIHME